jgi:ABC-type uncharacterized transport system permease subunit
MSEPTVKQVNGLAVGILLLPLMAFLTMTSLMFVGVSVAFWEAAVIFIAVKAVLGRERG